MKKVIFLLTLILALLALSIPEVAQACAPAPPPKAGKAVIENANLLIVWRYSDVYTGFVYPNRETEETAKYTFPGLYPNDSSTVPIWTMPYQDNLGGRWFGKLYISSNRRFLAMVSGSTLHRPLAFYEEGRLLKKYSHKEIDPVLLSQSGGSCFYTWVQEMYFDESNGVLAIQQTNGKKVAYSIYTGEPSTFSTFRFEPFILLWTILSFLILDMFWIQWWLKRRCRK
jgi:hypothetical protein